MKCLLKVLIFVWQILKEEYLNEMIFLQNLRFEDLLLPFSHFIYFSHNFQTFSFSKSTFQLHQIWCSLCSKIFFTKKSFWANLIFGVLFVSARNRTFNSINRIVVSASFNKEITFTLFDQCHTFQSSFCSRYLWSF